MSGRMRTMGAGHAGASTLGVNPNLNVGGGSKKQGIPSRVGKDRWADRAIVAHANGSVDGRNKLFKINQLGGVGVGRSQFFVK